MFYDTDVPVLLFCSLVSREWRLGQEHERVESGEADKTTREWSIVSRDLFSLYCLVPVLYYLVPDVHLVTELVLMH